MSRFPIIQFITLLWLLPLVACARSTEGMRILEDLRRDGLLLDHGDRVVPARSVQERSRLKEAVLPANGELTLRALFDAADRLNPRIAAARARLGATGGRAWQASLHPNPTLGLESENVRPSGGGFGASETTLRVTQPVIISDRREAAIAAGTAEMDVKRWQLQQTRREVHSRVRAAVTEIAYMRDAIARHEQLLELARRTLHIADTRFEARAAPESEATRARVEASSLELSIERLTGELASTSERLDTLLGGHHVDVQRVSVQTLERALAERLPDLEQLEAAVRAAHPSVQAARAQVEAAERRVELARALRYPDITAGLGVGVDHGDDEGFIEAGVGIPLPLFDRNQGEILAARFDVIRARHEAEAVSNELTGLLAEAYRRWESSASRLGTFEHRILSGARRSYEQTSAGYEAGNLPFLDLLDAQRTVIEATISQMELARSVSLSLAEVHEILGESPGPEQPHTGDAP